MSRFGGFIKNRISPQNLYYLFLLRTNPSLFMVNFLFQRIFRLDSDCPFLKHYTTKVISGNKIMIDTEQPDKTLKSFFNSGGCYIQAENGIEIGTETFWSMNVVLMSASYDLETLREKEISRPIKLGKHCWLGANVVVLPEVEIGDHTVVGAGSVVTKSFTQGSCVIAGVPARIIKKFGV